jgi:lysophospholipase L1-like esterase
MAPARSTHAASWPSRLGRGLRLLLLPALLAGCDDEDGLVNRNPGANDLNVVAAFGDSITEGNRCPCTPYPARLAALTGKNVYNFGIGGSRARNNVGRAGEIIARTRPAYMLILYGVNDLIHSLGVGSTLDAVEQMVVVCKENNVLPVVATYPIPVKSYRLFAFNIISLNQGIRDLARRHGIRCVDLEKEFARPGFPDPAGDVQSDEALFTNEGLHPNEDGTQIMAMAFADLFQRGGGGPPVRFSPLQVRAAASSSGSVTNPS